MTSKLIRIPKILYFRTLCLLLNPKSKGLDPYQGSPFRSWATSIVPGRKVSAVQLLISGSVIGVGFRSWIQKKAHLNGLDCLVFPRSKKTIEVILIGEGKDVESVALAAWKGPAKAKVEKIKEKWFNKPRKVSLPAIQPENEEILWSGDSVELIRTTIKQLEPLLKRPNQFTQTGLFSNAGEIQRAALNKNLSVARFSNINFLLSPNHMLGLQQSQTSRVSTTVRALTDHKHLTKEFLVSKGLPVPKGMIFTKWQDAKEYFRTCGYPVVVKPVSGSYGQGITVDVRTESSMEVAWLYAKKYHEQIVVEELIKGIDVRVLVIGKTAKAALMRVPANVIGDGSKTIERLIDDKNKNRLANPRLAKALIVPDAFTENFLSRQGHSLSSIPKEGEVVFLHLKANIGAGADSINITEYLHPDLLALAEEAASSFGVDDFWGIDLLVEAIDKPRHSQHCSIIEVNSRANIYNVQFPMYGKPVDAAQELVDYLFPENITDESYPLESIRLLISGQIDDTFFEDTVKLARSFNLQGSIQSGNNEAEILVHGRKHLVAAFIFKLYSPAEGQVVDNLQISPLTASEKELSSLFAHNTGNLLKPETPTAEEQISSFDTGSFPVTAYETESFAGDIDINAQFVFK